MQQTQLQTAQLGEPGSKITRVGFGAWAIGGGGWEFGWEPQEDGKSIQTIHRALELGVSWVDTAAGGLELSDADVAEIENGSGLEDETR